MTRWRRGCQDKAQIECDQHETHWFHCQWSVSLMTYNMQNYNEHESFDASGSIIDITVHRITRCIIRTASRNIDAVMIRLHLCFPIYQCTAQSLLGDSIWWLKIDLSSESKNSDVISKLINQMISNLVSSLKIISRIDAWNENRVLLEI